MLGLGWSHRVDCIRVLALNTALVAFNLTSLGLAGLGIDFIKQQVDSGMPPEWPLGLTPPQLWSPFQIVLAIAAGVLLSALCHAVLRFAATLALARLTQRVLTQLRADVYAKLQRLSFRFYDANQSSSIINRAAGDVLQVRNFIDGVIVKVLSVLLTLGVYLAYMLQVHAPLTLACLATTPFLWIGAVYFSRTVQPAYRKAGELVDKVVLRLVENVHGVHVIKGFARQSEEAEKFRRANEKVREQKQTIFWHLSTFQPYVGLLTQANLLVLLGYGGYLVIQGELSLGTGLFVFANLLQAFGDQVSQVTAIANTVQSSLIGAERVFEVLDAREDITSQPEATRLPQVRGAVRFEHVSFGYKPGEMVLSDLNFEVHPGECLGIVGETGAGKSTLLSLIGRLYDVTKGRVCVDGVDVRELDLVDLRRAIGSVFQESFLFSHTVAANISFGRPDASEDAIQSSAEIAAAHGFISEMPDGYETLVGEHGSNLSGGQRQRLSLARALLVNPPILLLDDATAAVDPGTEQEIQQAISHALVGRTTIMVSNRVSALRRADRILVLDRGRIAALGTHEELIETNSFYRQLVELQCGGQSSIQNRRLQTASPAA